MDLLPLDYAILEALPKQGAMMGFHNLGATVKHLMRKWRDQSVTSAQLNGRVRTLKFYGLAVDVMVMPVGDGKGWQITPEGERVLAEHQAAGAAATRPIEIEAEIVRTEAGDVIDGVHRIAASEAVGRHD